MHLGAVLLDLAVILLGVGLLLVPWVHRGVACFDAAGSALHTGLLLVLVAGCGFQG